MRKLSIITHLIIWFTAVSALIYILNIAEMEINTVSNLLQCAAALIALVCSAINAYLQRNSALKFAWLLLALGIVSLFIGYITYSLDDMIYGPKSIFLVVSKLAALPTYVLLLTAIVAAIRSYTKKGARLTHKLRLFAELTFTGLSLYVFVIRPIIKSSANSSDLMMAITAPITDFSLLVLTFMLIQLLNSIHRDAEGKAWQIIGIGLIVFVITDGIYSVLAVKKIYHTGMFVDMGWIIGLAILTIGVSEYIKVSSKERTIDSIKHAMLAKVGL